MGNNSDQFDYSAFTGAPKAPASPAAPVRTGQPSEPAAKRVTNPTSSVAASTGWLATEPVGNLAAAKPSGPPLIWLATAIACAIVAGAVAATSGGNALTAGASWLLGGPIAIAFLAIFTFQDTARRADVFYSRRTWIPLVYGVTIALIFIAIIVSALQLALWVGRL